MRKTVILLCIVLVFFAFYKAGLKVTGMSILSVETMDGLKLEFSDRGVVNSIVTPAGHLESSDSADESGFFVRDLARGTKLFHLTGTMQAQEGKLIYNVSDDNLDIKLRASFEGKEKSINVNIDIADLSNSERVLSVYFVLPIDTHGWIWGDDIRNSRLIEGKAEMSNTVNVGLGAIGKMSRYPLAAVSGTDGIAIGYPLDHPAVIRLAANHEKKQFYIAYDIALSPLTKKPGETNLKALIFRYSPEWGFRAAMKKYYEIYPEFFLKRVKKGGIWAYQPSYLNRIPHIKDFGFAFHTFGFNAWSLVFEDKNDINSLQYLAEPWSYYMKVPSSLAGGSYDDIIDYLKYSAERGKLEAVAALSSGVVDYRNKFVFWLKGKDVSWCPNCLIFTFNSDPDINDSEYLLNKAYFDWQNKNFLIYSKDSSSGILDGEFIDSIENRYSVLDYSDSHIAAADFPLTYDSNVLRPAVSVLFATYEFSKWVEEKVRGMRKLLMANGVLRKFAFPAHLFDIMGVEVGDWILDPEKDISFNFWRTMSYQKPYCLLYNAPLEKITHDLVEQYFKKSLFYAVYPGMGMGHTRADIYFDKSYIYERDRDLFKKFIPLIQTLGEAGWQPVTYILSSEPKVYVERYGKGTSLYITTRNADKKALDYTLSLEAHKLVLPLQDDMTFKDLISGNMFNATVNGQNLEIKDTLESGGVRMFYLSYTS